MIRRTFSTSFIPSLLAIGALHTAPASARTIEQQDDMAAPSLQHVAGHGSRADMRFIASDSGLSSVAKSAAMLVGMDAPGVCWRCDYAARPSRQFLPGEMTFRFRPVGGTVNFHF